MEVPPAKAGDFPLIMLVRRVGYSDMTDYRFLTSDRNVQQTAFANGVAVTVNFGSTTCPLPDGKLLEPMGFRVQ